MGTELVRPCIKEERAETELVPPGFESLASFTLKRVRDKETVTTCSDSASVSESQTMMKTEFEYDDDENIARSFKRRSWINYTLSDGNSADESDSEQSRSLRPSLPKGVIRGCSECVNCQKVITRWLPKEACRHNLEAVPVFYPSEEEFKDTLNYIASIRHHAEKYGICRIVPLPLHGNLLVYLRRRIYGTQLNLQKLMCLLRSGETVGEVKIVSDMHERKALIARKTDAFFALAGFK